MNTLKQLFIQRFSDLKQFGKGGSLPIHLACQMNNSRILRIIIDVAHEALSQKKFEQMMNQVTKDTYWEHTPLMVAIKNNSVDCIKILCQYDSVVQGILKYKARYPNYNAFEFACYYNNIGILKILSNCCDLTQLHSSMSQLKQIIKYGISKRCIRDVGCIQFVDQLSNKAKSKQATALKHKQASSLTNNQLTCCYNHVLSSSYKLIPKQCDICQEKSIFYRFCSKCASKQDGRIFPAIICEKCVTATSIWSMIVNSSPTILELNEMMDHLMNADILERVKFMYN